MVTGLADKDKDIRLNAYNMIKTEITSATTSMTSIPKPLKFLKSHYQTIKDIYASTTDTEFKHLLSDLLAVLSMIASTNEQENSLYWVILGNKTNITTWGQEFVRNLSGEIGNEFITRLENGQSYDDLVQLVNAIVPFLISNYSENEAIDLLLEVEKLDDVMEYVNLNNYKRICNYLKASANYAADTDEMKSVLQVVYNIYMKFNEYSNALRTAIKMNNMIFIKQTFNSCDHNTKKQLAFILSRQKIYLKSDDMEYELVEIMNNLKISDYYKRLGRELNVLEPKHPEEVFKSHLEEKKTTTNSDLNSYRINMAVSIASAFINAGFGTENLLSKKENDWLNRNKEEGLIATLGGLGLVNLWDIESGPNELEKHMNINEMDPYKRGGYNIGLGVLSSGVRDENYIAYGILSEQLKDKKYN
jgi:26S proteasome regulatory subunit N1